MLSHEIILYLYLCKKKKHADFLYIVWPFVFWSCEYSFIYIEEYKREATWDKAKGLQHTRFIYCHRMGLKPQQRKEQNINGQHSRTTWDKAGNK